MKFALILKSVMISRTLGPEFGGSIGTLFFLANIVSSALCISGCIEGLVQNIGPSGYFIDGLITDGRWWRFLYCSILNIINLIICLIGASMFAKTTVFVLGTVCLCLTVSIFSFFYQGSISVSCHFVIKIIVSIKSEFQVPLPDHPNFNNVTIYSNYTGLSLQTFKENLYPHYGHDYTSGNTVVTFAKVFGVLFSGVTGIMAGANMSGWNFLKFDLFL